MRGGELARVVIGGARAARLPGRARWFVGGLVAGVYLDWLLRVLL